MAEGTLAQVLAGEAHWCVLHGDSFRLLCDIPENSCDAGIIDPPAGISFMGEEWDDDKGGMLEWVRWQACIMQRTLRALKPGAHALVWALPRTSHWTGSALELAGFEIRGQIQHWFGSGFPKSLDVSKAIDEHLGAERPIVGTRVLTGTAALSTEEKGGTYSAGVASSGRTKEVPITSAATPEAKQWDGWGTALKPGHEVWWLVRKPLERGLSVAENVLKWGTGALNIDGCRIEAADGNPSIERRESARRTGNAPMSGVSARESAYIGKIGRRGAPEVYMAERQSEELGRWPADIVLTHDYRCEKIGTVEVQANPSWDTPNRNTEPSAFTGAVVSKVRHANRRDGEESADRRYTERGSTSFAALPGARRDTETVTKWRCIEGCPVLELDRQSGLLRSGFMAAGTERATRTGYSGHVPHHTKRDTIAYEGTASRFFQQFEWDEDLDDVWRFVYFAKPSRAERDAGLEHFRARSAADTTKSKDGQARLESPRTGAGRTGGARNTHPTVKGQEMLRYFARLITPPGGVVLTPYCGSGSEGMAARAEGYRFIGIELNDTDEKPYVSIARARISHVEGMTFVPRESLRAASPPKQVGLFERVGR